MKAHLRMSLARRAMHFPQNGKGLFEDATYEPIGSVGGTGGFQSPWIAPLKGAVRRTGWFVILAASKSPCMTLRAFAQDEPPLWML